MPRVSKVKENMNEDIGKRRENVQKFVTKWVEIDGRKQRQVVVRKYDRDVHVNDIDLPEKAQANFEDVEIIEYLNTF